MSDKDFAMKDYRSSDDVYFIGGCAGVFVALVALLVFVGGPVFKKISDDLKQEDKKAKEKKKRQIDKNKQRPRRSTSRDERVRMKIAGNRYKAVKEIKKLGRQKNDRAILELRALSKKLLSAAQFRLVEQTANKELSNIYTKRYQNAYYRVRAAKNEKDLRTIEKQVRPRLPHKVWKKLQESITKKRHDLRKRH